MAYKIGSFNVRGLQQKEGKEQDFNIIADIIKGIKPVDIHGKKKKEASPFTIVALQEVVNEDQFNSFKNYYLGKPWNGYYVKPDSFSNSSAKGYAYVWNEDEVELMYGEKSKDEKFYPHILNEFEDNKVSMDLSEMSKLTRKPMYARFRMKSCNMELRLLNVHITFGISKAMPDEYKEASGVRQRKEEFRILTEIVYPAVNKFVYKNGCNNYYTIMLGDYNLNLYRKWTKGTRIYDQLASKAEIKPIIDSLTVAERGALRLALYETMPHIDKEKFVIDDQSIVTLQDALTTLKNNLSGNKANRIINMFEKKKLEVSDAIEKLIELAGDEYKVFHSNYDHFTYDEKRFDGVTINRPYRMDSIIDDYFRTSNPNVRTGAEAAEMYKKMVSDHIPIVMEIDLRDGR